MSLRLERENRGKLLLIGASVLMWLVIGILFITYGYEETWQLWKVPTQRLPFMDFRLIPGSAESFARGYEPSVENPYDPNGRIFNYPAFWRLFFYTGVTQDDTVWISVSMIVLFFISAFLFPQRLSVSGAIGMLLVLFSPASLLLYERGNVDLIVFVLCVMIVLAAGYSASLAALLILFASIMKLFPILGLSVLLTEPKKKFLRLSMISSVVLLVYMLAAWDSVRASWTLTMRGDGLSYGTDVLVDRYGPAISQVFSSWLSPEQIDPLLAYGPMAAGLALLLVVLIPGIMVPRQPQTLAERNFAAFRMGASVYVGTFLLGNNWDYRLPFLVLVVPQLVEWMRSLNKTYRLVAWLCMGLTLFSCWHMWLTNISLVSILGSAGDSMKFWIILDEFFNWMLFAGLIFLLSASAPDWLKELAGSLLPKGISRPSHEQSSSTTS